MSPMIQQVYPNKQTVLQDRSSPPSFKSPTGLPCAQTPVTWGVLFKPLVPNIRSSGFIRRLWVKEQAIPRSREKRSKDDMQTRVRSIGGELIFTWLGIKNTSPISDFLE